MQTQTNIYAKDNIIVIKPQQSKIIEVGGKYKGRKPIRPINITNIRDYIDYSKI